MKNITPWYTKPTYTMLLLVSGIFISEAVIMIIFSYFELVSVPFFAMLDAGVLTISVIPGLYILVLRPQMKWQHQRELLAERLEINRKDFKAIIGKNTDGVLVLNLHNIIQYTNQAAQEILQDHTHLVIGDKFPFSVQENSTREININDANQPPNIIEMRTQKTNWHNEPALLVSLRDINEMVRLRENLKEKALSNELTGLKNRRHFLMLAEQQLKTAMRAKHRLSVIFMDIDDLKKINDSFGHKIGDQALLDFADILKKAFRDSDIIAHFGGDEFVCSLSSLDESEETACFERLQKMIDYHNQHAKRLYQLQISYGVAHYDVSHPVSLDTLIDRADYIMYQQKLLKKNR